MFAEQNCVWLWRCVWVRRTHFALQLGRDPFYNDWMVACFFFASCLALLCPQSRLCTPIISFLKKHFCFHFETVDQSETKNGTRHAHNLYKYRKRKQRKRRFFLSLLKWSKKNSWIRYSVQYKQKRNQQQCEREKILIWKRTKRQQQKMRQCSVDVLFSFCAVPSVHAARAFYCLFINSSISIILKM